VNCRRRFWRTSDELDAGRDELVDDLVDVVDVPRRQCRRGVPGSDRTMIKTSAAKDPGATPSSNTTPRESLLGPALDVSHGFRTQTAIPLPSKPTSDSLRGNALPLVAGVSGLRPLREYRRSPRRPTIRNAPGAVREVLTNPKYTGYMVWNRRATKDKRHPGKPNPKDEWVI
jgi:hypothetical protein